MIPRVIRAIVGNLLWLAVLVMAIFALDVGRIAPIPGTEFVTEGTLCDDPTCQTGTPVTLPYFGPIRPEATPETRTFRFQVQSGAGPDSLWALYLPKQADRFDLRVNDAVLFQSDPQRNLWNTPMLVPLPTAAVPAGAVSLEITLYSPPAERMELQPFFIGPEALLAPVQGLRNFFGPGIARFATGLMLVLAGAFGAVWAFRRRELEYLWLGLSCLAALPTLVHYGWGIEPAAGKLWTMAWILSISVYVYLVLRFLRRLVDLNVLWPERLYGWALGLGTLAILVSPGDYSFHLSFALNSVLTAPLAVSVLVLLWLFNGALGKVDFWVFYLCLSLSAALGIYGLYLHLSPAPLRSMALFQGMPLIMSLACLWLLLSRLIRSIRGFEALTATLNQTIAAKSAELEANFAELDAIRKREAVAEERDRIMLDLHDGIGGQLVSVLAYMETNHVGDDKVRRALEDALRDLALMLDSMENHDSLVTLLGMLRTRLEGLLSEHGIEFDWQVHGEPELPRPGPSQSLHLARIVQEAITNVIKHAGADTIRVYVDEATIQISDNGKGFDLSTHNAKTHPSHGIANMQRRCAAIGAEFNMTSSASGSSISISLRPGGE